MDTLPRRPLPTRDALVELTTVLGELMAASEAQAGAIRALADTMRRPAEAVAGAEVAIDKLDASVRHVQAAYQQTLAVLSAMAGSDDG